jgi:putative FmdB family regulatory protein
MPTYEYRCEFCHELTEAFQKMSDKPLTSCPHCGKEGLHRIVSGGAGVLYKGEGWYVTDYSKKSSGGKDMPSTPSSTTSTVSKSAEKSATPSSEPAAPAPAAPATPAPSPEK